MLATNYTHGPRIKNLTGPFDADSLTGGGSGLTATALASTSSTAVLVQVSHLGRTSKRQIWGWSTVRAFQTQTAAHLG